MMLVLVFSVHTALSAPIHTSRGSLRSLDTSRSALPEFHASSVPHVLLPGP